MYECEDCGKEFDTGGELGNHRANHHSSDEYTCDDCDEVFTSLTSYAAHRTKHSGGDPHTCEICGEEFESAASHASHKASHESGENHICDECGEEFDNGPALGRHKSNHHLKGEYNCEECGESFESARSLQGHKLIHSGGNVHECEFCGVGFGSKPALWAHKTKHGDGGYFCEVCGQEFDSAASLGAHVHHHETEYENVYSNDELIEVLQSLKRELGKVPSKRDLLSDREMSPTTYRDRFGSWFDALQAAGFDASEYPVSGEDHPSWKGGRFPYGSGWTPQKKKKVRARDGHECVSCGMSSDTHREKYGVDLHVHHITPARKVTNANERNSMDNLVTLCQQCHSNWEAMAPLRPAVN